MEKYLHRTGILNSHLPNELIEICNSYFSMYDVININAGVSSQCTVM